MPLRGERDPGAGVGVGRAGEKTATRNLRTGSGERFLRGAVPFLERESTAPSSPLPQTTTLISR